MQEEKYSIKSWAKDDKPREKLLSRGPASLSDSELIAILLGSGTKEMDVLELARQLLNHCRNSVASLSKLSAIEIRKIKGIGEARAATIVAAMELGRRRESAGINEQIVLRQSADVAPYLRAMLRDHQHEVFAVLFLNRANRILNFRIVSEGGITGTVADPRIILKKALEENAVSIILCHNHPSGNLLPSHADHELTSKIREACRYFDIRLLDHIIVSEDGFYSFADSGDI